MGSRRSSPSRFARRGRLGDVALLALALLVIVATFKALGGQVVRLHRQALDRRIVEARFRAAGEQRGFGFPRVFAGVADDRVCAPRRGGLPPPHRLCFVLRTSGPLSRRIVGGYRLPSRGTDVRRRRYGCFGAPRRARRCGGAAPAAPAPARGLAARLAARIAAPWPHLQAPDGRFRNVLGGGTRYGEAALGYALLQAGLRERDRAVVRTGLRGLDLALRQMGCHARQSVFENLAAAAAYDLARRSLYRDPTFRRMRPRWERFLETRQLKELDSEHKYDNHYLADAVATLELLRTGLRSSDPASVLGNRAAALAAVQQLVDVRIPAMAARSAVTVHGERTFVLSDPPDDPLAYQGLSLGLYARAIALLGPRASAAARTTLAEAARASWWLAAPDGDLAWMGRSDEESWALAATAYGAARAARVPGDGRPQPRDLRALAMRALLRLRGYGVGPRGPNVTPALRVAGAHAARGLDSNAGGPSFTGITLMMLDWALPALRGPIGSIGSDRDGGVQQAVGPARLAVVRRGDVWFALKRDPTVGRPDDLRYGFGLLALKVRRGGAWRDVAPVRPQPGVAPSQPRTPSGGQVRPPPDSVGPVLLGAGRPPGMPYGDAMAIGRGGTVRIRGGWRDADGVTLRSGVTFVFAPTRNGLRLLFDRRAGDRLQYSAFFAGAARPRRRPHALEAGATRVTWRGRAAVAFEGGYASAVDPWLERARITLAPGRGPARLETNFVGRDPSTDPDHA